MNQDFTEMFTGRHLDKLAMIERGDLLLPWFLRPCRLKILMVVDGYPGNFLNVSFSHSYFGLSAVLDTLRNNPEFFVRFDVTRAHRQTDTFKPDPATEPVLHARYGPHFENFRFTQPGFNINDYDQVWLFGARSNPNDVDRLTDAELEVLARWMDQGGGLFATGDHADLGASLCSRVPRAATMRRWTFAQGVPSATGPDRHDTNLKGHDAFYTFDDESDDIPMRTSPKFYPLWSWNPFRHRRAPHPILCGTDGVINILPDHPHEGHVIDESDVVLGNNFSFGAYVNKPEYPTVSGVQTRPEVIARAHVQDDHPASGFKGVANEKSFGAIGAYNGHSANVGRVVVDSTWHHWFDVNLTGRPVGNLDSLPHDMTNPKTLGFLATPAGMTALARIQNYFRNVAMWLTTPAKQNCMFFRATWGGIIRYPLAERLDPRLPIWELGGSARDVIGRRAGQCTLSWWLRPLIPVDLHRIFIEERPIPDPNPCLTCPPIDLLEIYLMGGITREMLTLAYKLEGNKEISEEALAKAFVKGFATGAKELNNDYQKSLARSRVFSQRLGNLTKAAPSERLFLEDELKPQNENQPAGKKTPTKKSGKGKKR